MKHHVDRLATGFLFTEGPVWMPDGYLVFSDIHRNKIFRWDPVDGVSVFRECTGCSHAQPGDVHWFYNYGSNGLTIDAHGRLTVCEHGNRRVTRHEHDGSLTVLADKYQGKRLNSPNDLVYHRNGDLYFSDPPYGLPKEDEDPAKELPHNGVYRLHNGALELLYDGLMRPNGVAFSPNYDTLYVANSDPERKLWMKFELNEDGSMRGASVFVDANHITEPGLPDGLKVNAQGIVFATGPGGVWVIAPDGSVIGRAEVPEVPTNCAWGPDGSLYVTAQTSVYRFRFEQLPA
jgi:gluconolactonase